MFGKKLKQDGKLTILLIDKYQGHPILIQQYADLFQAIVVIDGKYYQNNLLVSSESGKYDEKAISNAVRVLVNLSRATVKDSKKTAPKGD